MMFRRALVALSLVPLAVLIASCVWAQDVRNAKRPVVDAYEGVQVRDEYQWLENGKDPAVRQWSEAQNGRLRGYIDRQPIRARMQEELEELYEDASASYFGV